MKTFLQIVAEDLYNKYGEKISDLTIVFPNYRARLFFSKNLVECINKPIWAPKYTTIKELFETKKSLFIEDTLRLVCILYKHYKKYIEQKESEICETFDSFYFWGEILLNDFDDIDKNLVDARQLFSNMKDLANLKNDYKYLSDEQKEILKKFFASFSAENQSKIRQHFINVWDSLFDIYTDFKKELREKNIAYEGMLYRDVIENINCDDFTTKKYVFIGFNVLNNCEIELFKKLHKCGKAIFYWDYDLYYTEFKTNDCEHEAAVFIKQNLSLFPNELDKSYFNQYEETPKKIEIINTSTDSSQAHYLDSYLTNMNKEGYKDSDTAVVLCNEGLLLPVLHSIPNCIKDVNVTMGFPLSQTPIYSLIINLLNIQAFAGKDCFRYKEILQLFHHPYMKLIFCNDETKENNIDYIINNERIYSPTESFLNETCKVDLFKKLKGENCLELTSWLLKFIEFIANFHKNKKEELDGKAKNEIILYDDLYEESVFRAYTEIKKIDSIIKNNEMDINYSLLYILIPRLLSSISVPFKGEPIKGLQIMGFLETRNLDFKNIILLSCNETILPKSGKENSFIPYIIRKAYNMTTIEHKNSLYAYYFYRLLQRASNASFLYNSSADSKSRGEKSRFIWQLQSDTISLQNKGLLSLNFYDIKSSIPMDNEEEITIEKTDEIIDFLKKKFQDKPLSPSALNCYIDCSLKFFLQYYKGLKTEEDIDEEIDEAIFGNIFHKVAELIYTDLSKDNKVISRETLEKLRDDKNKCEWYVERAFKTEYFHYKDESKPLPILNGKQVITKRIVYKFLTHLLDRDIKEAPITILGIEDKKHFNLDVNSNKGNFQIKVGGIIDRYDLRNNIVNVIDYKTGGNISSTTIENCFETSKDRPYKILQALLYAYVLYKGGEKKVIEPRLFFVGKKNVGEDKILIGKGKDACSFMPSNIDEFGNLLQEKINEIFDINTPFTQADEKIMKCSYCNFKNICKRE